MSRYQDGAISLGLPAKDATDFVAVLKQQDGRLYKRVEVRMLVDAQATRQAVLDGLKWLRAAPSAGDVGMLFLAGHGVTDAADGYHFLPHDVRRSGIPASSVSEKELRDTLVAIKGKSLFFIDTCFAGQAIGVMRERDVTRLAHTLSSADAGVIVFSGSGRRQLSLENPSWGNGAFTKALVQGLVGQADFRREGMVTYKGLDYYVAKEVTTLTDGKQTPVTAVPIGMTDFALAALRAIAATTPTGGQP